MTATVAVRGTAGVVRPDAGVSRPGVGSGKSRLIGIDVARGLALLGMMAVHALVPYDENFNPNWVSSVATGHASALFAVLAGVGLALTTGRARVPRSLAGPTVAALAGRAAAVGAVGLALGYTDAGIAGVILAFYAVFFLLAIPLVFIRTRSLVLVGLAAAVLVPVLSHVVRPWLPVPTLENPSFGYLFTDPLGLLYELLLTGEYPALPWMSYICAGLIVGRLTLSSMKTAWWLLGVGVAMALATVTASWWLLGSMGGRAALLVAGTGFLDEDADVVPVDDLLVFGFDGTTPTTSWWWLATRASHGATPLDLLGTIGTSIAVLGAMLLLGHVTRPLLRRVIDVITVPLAAAGAMTLTLYTAHIIFMNSVFDVFGSSFGYVLQVVVVVMIGLVWGRFAGRGPLERLVSTVAARCRHAAESLEERTSVEQESKELSRANSRDLPQRKTEQELPQQELPQWEFPLWEVPPQEEPQHEDSAARHRVRLPGPFSAMPAQRPVAPRSVARRRTRRRP